MATSEKLDRAALAKLLSHFDQQLKLQDELSISESEREIAYLDDCMQELALKLANSASTSQLMKSTTEMDMVVNWLKSY